jgi:hypothetical protein
MASKSKTETAAAGPQARAQDSSPTRWRKVARTRKRWWKPEWDGAAIIVRLGVRVTRDTRFGTRTHYEMVNLVQTDDANGIIEANTPLFVREYATLNDLAQMSAGTVLRITPAGLEGQVKLFEVEVAE